jgi:hypothetical protein
MPFTDPPRVLIVGVSARAAADSAVRAGFRVAMIDAFSDSDLDPAVEVVPLAEGYSADAAARAARAVPCDAVVYLASFENRPDEVAALAAGRSLWGNDPQVLRHVRDPLRMAAAFRSRGHPVPRIRTGAVERLAGRWLAKPTSRGGGHGIRAWIPGTPAPPGTCLQEYIEGTPGSVVFAAAAGRAVTLGISRQIIGDAAFGASGFQYCGSIRVSPDRSDPDLVPFEAAARLASTAAERFGLVGVNCIDFVAAGGVPYPVEVNPRWSASMELLERAGGLSVFGIHAEACAGSRLPGPDLPGIRSRSPAFGKAVVFAREDLTIGDTGAWLAEAREASPGVRDVPREGTRIPAGRPVCTVFATGQDAGQCREALLDRARRVYAALG